LQIDLKEENNIILPEEEEPMPMPMPIPEHIPENQIIPKRMIFKIN
jgi:hypothetical protein